MTILTLIFYVLINNIEEPSIDGNWNFRFLNLLNIQVVIKNNYYQQINQLFSSENNYYRVYTWVLFFYF